uniref:Uncharacterized protein n=1 Tax=Romanomermis culicivorax TaxID=13658 RepID=A0A915K9C2_ROMCU
MSAILPVWLEHLLLSTTVGAFGAYNTMGSR